MEGIGGALALRPPPPSHDGMGRVLRVGPVGPPDQLLLAYPEGYTVVLAHPSSAALMCDIPWYMP